MSRLTCLLLCCAAAAGCGRPAVVVTSAPGTSNSVPENAPSRGKKDTVQGVTLSIVSVDFVKNPAETSFNVTFTVSNKTEGKRLRFGDWRIVTLKDQFGTEYSCRGSASQIYQPQHYRTMKVDPDESASDTLMFEWPTAKAKTFNLDIPSECVGMKGGTFRLALDRPD